jgi:hypothetical protein
VAVVQTDMPKDIVASSNNQQSSKAEIEEVNQSISWSTT